MIAHKDKRVIERGTIEVGSSSNQFMTTAYYFPVPYVFFGQGCGTARGLQPSTLGIRCGSPTLLLP
jgi:hypothetical protein